MKAFSLLGFILSLFFLLSCDKTNDPNNNPDTTAVDTSSNISFKGKITVIEDQFKGLEVVLAGSKDANFIMAFERQLDGTLLSFEPINDQPPLIMQDNEGNAWDMMGYAIRGPRKGQQLKSAASYIGYWFAWGTFYPIVDIYGQEKGDQNYVSSTSSDPSWTVPRNRVVSGGVPPDAIPALENPSFYSPAEVQNWLKSEEAITDPWIKDDDLIIGIKVGNEARAYPHLVLDWHEIVNDDIGDVSFAIIYCPLTGTATCWNRQLGDGVHTTFGVSGLLYNSNIVPYDRSTNSKWSQMRLESINGDLIRQPSENMTIVETTWGTWRAAYPETAIVNPDKTGYSRSYGRYPYGDYRTNDANLIFSVEYDDTRLGRKERVLGIIVDGSARVYTMDLF